MKRIKPYLKMPSVWFALALLLANGFAWVSVATRIDLVEAQPILHPEIAEIRAHWQARDAVGETFSVLVTDQMAMETIAWFMEPRDLPFSHPQIEIHPGYIVGGGLVHVLGLRTPVFGRAAIYLENGRPEATIEEVGIAGTKAPDFVLAAVAQAQQVYANLRLPIEITTLDMREGEVYIEGVYR
ncbi:MAG: hypothetical protein H6662_20065 [Ardenticatenaceae bacterium]|nr:hypothetical protein [Ardenticatenaceae bacterium]MCB8990474.1 hypothetical protein [Ardenticatenaceae bacterium]MCB9003488.1 hypothetical protein [Ardenticatenaceae bacterium]